MHKKRGLDIKVQSAFLQMTLGNSFDSRNYECGKILESTGSQTENVLVNNNVKVFQWSGQSTDLNSIENK